MEVHRTHQRLDALDARRARAAWSICRSARPSNDFYRRQSSRRWSVRRNTGVPGREHRAAQVAFSNRAPRFVGLRYWRRRRSWSPSPSTARRLDAVVQLTKQGFAFVFDRVTGKPVWPIEERPVPASDVAGEHASPTQPFPTKPPALHAAGRHARRRIRSDARVESGSANRNAEVPARPAIHAAIVARHADAARHHRRRELGRRRVRSRLRNALHQDVPISRTMVRREKDRPVGGKSARVRSRRGVERAIWARKRPSMAACL